MKQRIYVNLIPTYKTDIIDEYTRYDTKDTSVGDLVLYDELLGQLNKTYTIENISVSGGEIALLSDLYFDLLYKILKLYTSNIKVYTHFNQFNKALINGVDIINVQYNFTDTPNLFKNIKAAIQIGKIINIQTIDKACLKDNPETIIATLNNLNIKSWEIVPSTCFSEAIYRFLGFSKIMNFAFHNKLQLDGLVDIDNYDIQNVYLTPHNKFAIKVNSILKEIDTLDELKIELNKTKEKQEEYCDDCRVKLKCMANYYKDFTTDSESPCSFSDLIYKYASITKKD